MASNNQSKSSSQIQDISVAMGKIPPYALDMEEAVLGALMLEKDAIEVVLDILKPEAFYKIEHQKIYRAIRELVDEQSVVDLLTVTQKIRDLNLIAEVGGAGYIAGLTNKVASAAHIDYHARVIAQKFIQRELIRVSSETLKSAFDNTQDVYELLNDSEQRLFEISSNIIKKEILPISPILDDAIQRIQDAKEKDLNGVPSGFPSIDKVTMGWQKGDLIIVAARPSMGKTAFTLSMARNMAVEHQQSVAFFSLEMPSVQLVNRLIVSETEIDHNVIKSGNLSNTEWETLEQKVDVLYNSNIFIDDSPSLSIFDLSAKCRRLKAKSSLDIVIIDYLQLMKGDSSSGNREQEVSMVSRSLKQLAKELDIPVIALAQLNRGVELRSGNDKRPKLADLRESGAIEQDADIIAFINRPERMGITQDEEGNSTKGLAEIIIAKHRNGQTADVRLKFVDSFARFEEWDIRNQAISLNPEVTLGSKMNDDFIQPLPPASDDDADNFTNQERKSAF